MPHKSPYQLINRGRKDKPCWTVEDCGKYVYSSRRRSLAEGYLRMLRDLARQRDKQAAANAAEQADKR